MTVWAWVYFYSLLLGAAVVAVSGRRSPVRMLPWVLLIILLPVVGFLLYLYFGVSARKRHTGRHYRLKAPGADLLPLQDTIGSSSSSSSLARLLYHSAGAPLTRAYQTEFFTNGADYLAYLTDRVHRARRYILLQGFRIDTDGALHPLIEALRQAAARGVAVFILYDKSGSKRTPRRVWRALQEAGIYTRPFADILFPYLAASNYRNHRKAVIIDGIEAFTGNIDPAASFLVPRETHRTSGVQLAFRGPAVEDLQRAFIQDCIRAGARLSLLKQLTPLPDSSPQGTHSPLQIVPTEPTQHWNTLEQLLWQLLSQARECICIETPVFHPTLPVKEALLQAHLCGVRVQIIIPTESSSVWQKLATRSFCRELLPTGVEFYLKPGYSNTFYLITDRQTALLGSARLDFRSLESNYELNTLLYGAEAVAPLCARFDQTLRLPSTTPLAPPEPKGNRLTTLPERIGRLLVPLL